MSLLRTAAGLALGFALVPLVSLLPGAWAAQDHTNYDETKVGHYQLPPLLVMRDGTAVKTAGEWMAKRRPEILELYRANVQGRSPAAVPKDLSWKVVEEDRKALGGTAHR